MKIFPQVKIEILVEHFLDFQNLANFREIRLIL